MFKNYLEYIQVILLIHIKGMCSPEKVNSGDDTQKAYRDLNSIERYFCLIGKEISLYRSKRQTNI